MFRFVACLATLALVARAGYASPDVRLGFEHGYGLRVTKVVSAPPSAHASASDVSLFTTIALGLAFGRTDGVMVRADGVLELSQAQAPLVFGGVDLQLDRPWNGGRLGLRVAGLMHSETAYTDTSWSHERTGAVELGVRLRSGGFFGSFDVLGTRGNGVTTTGALVGGGFSGKPAGIAFGIEAGLLLVLGTIAFKSGGGY